MRLICTALLDRGADSFGQLFVTPTSRSKLPPHVGNSGPHQGEGAGQPGPADRLENRSPLAGVLSPSGRRRSLLLGSLCKQAEVTSVELSAQIDTYRREQVLPGACRRNRHLANFGGIAYSLGCPNVCRDLL